MGGSMLQLGWKAGTEQYSPGELLEYAVVAEEAGFDSINVSDHFHPWSEKGQACFVWTWLGAAAARTMPRMVELGVAYTDDEEKAIAARKEYWASTFVPALFTERIYTPEMSETNGKVVGSDTI